MKTGSASSDQIIETFLQRLPDLSAGWSPPSFSFRLGARFVKDMMEELRIRQDSHWHLYYRHLGIPWYSDDFITPSSLNEDNETDAPASDRFEQEEREDMLHHRLAEALWPMIKAGERPLGTGIRRLIRSRIRDWRWFESLWYWAIAHLFHSWYSSVIHRYLSEHELAIEDAEKRVQQLSTAGERIKLRREIAASRRRYQRERNTLLYSTRAVRDCLFWWLSEHEIWLDPAEAEEVVQRVGLKRFSWGRIDRIDW